MDEHTNEVASRSIDDLKWWVEQLRCSCNDLMRENEYLFKRVGDIWSNQLALKGEIRDIKKRLDTMVEWKEIGFFSTNKLEDRIERLECLSQMGVKNDRRAKGEKA